MTQRTQLTRQRLLLSLRFLLPSLTLLTLAPLGCSSGSNSLSGSESQVYDLSFNSVVIVLQGSTVSIKYAGSNGDPAILAVDIANLTPVSGSSIPLTGPDPATGQPRGVLHNVDSTGVTNQLSMKVGSAVVFDQVPKIKSTLSGQFNATLTDGYTLDGTFSATVSAPSP